MNWNYWLVFLKQETQEERCQTWIKQCGRLHKQLKSPKSNTFVCQLTPALCSRSDNVNVSLKLNDILTHSALQEHCRSCICLSFRQTGTVELFLYVFRWRWRWRWWWWHDDVVNSVVYSCHVHIVDLSVCFSLTFTNKFSWYNTPYLALWT